MRYIFAGALFLLLILVALDDAQAAPAARVKLRLLASRGHEFVGQRIVTRGCLEDASPHAIIIRSCGTHDWRTILILHSAVEILPQAMFSPDSNVGQIIEADVVGVLTEENNDRTAGVHLVLDVERIANVMVHKP